VGRALRFFAWGVDERILAYRLVRYGDELRRDYVVRPSPA
jgi:hypothetical protein